MTDYYLDPLGNDGNAGTSAGVGNAWLTIDHAVTNSADSDTFNFAAGTYTWESLEISGAARNLIGESALTTIIDAAGGTESCLMAGVSTISNLHFKDSIGAVISVPFGIFGIFSGALTQTFTNCIFSGLVSNGASRNSMWMDHNTWAGSGKYLCTIDACLAYDLKPQSSGSQYVFGSDNNTGTTYAIKNSRFIFADNGANSLLGVVGMTEVNSSFISTNNIFYAPDGISAFDAGGTGTETATYTCQYGFSSTLAGTGNIFVDPEFIDPVNLDFRLQQGSPCEGTGTIT